MTDQTRLQDVMIKGGAPWEPAANISEWHCWHANDVPTVGTFQIGDDTYAFSVVEDLWDESVETTWLYIHLDEDEVEVFANAQFENVRAMSDFIQEAFTGRTAVVATAKNFELTTWSVQDTTMGVFPAVVFHRGRHNIISAC